MELNRVFCDWQTLLLELKRSQQYRHLGKTQIMDENAQQVENEIAKKKKVRRKEKIGMIV